MRDRRGMLVQADGTWLTVLVPAYPAWLRLPTRLAVIGIVAHQMAAPSPWRTAPRRGAWRASWRTGGTAVIEATLTLFLGLVVVARIRDTPGGPR